MVACMLQAASALYAQQPDKSQEINLLLWEENLEQLAVDEDYSWEAELEELSRCLQEPVNLNTATREQLEQFPFLSDLQVENLLAYVYIHGQMQTVYELQLVEEMDKRTIELLLPFVCVRQTDKENRYPSLKKMLKYGRHEVLTRLDIPFYTRKGYEKNYLGTPSYHSLRYGFHYSDYLQLGLSAEKDAGEPMFGLHNAKGYDFYSFYFLVKNLGRLKALALGNYRLSFGQGLVLSTDFRLGKSFSLSTSEYRSGGVKKHSSTDEYNYFRGAAATVGILPSLDVSAFYSHRTLDATVEEGEIVSIAKTGLHRTQKEADKRNACALQLAGGNVTYEKNAFKVGATGIYYFFDRPYEPALRKYARYNLHGTRFYNLGIDYRLRLGRLSWTGEAATGTKGYALLNRLRYDFSQDYHALLIHRFYSSDYWAWFARSFGEGSTPQNENGWYLAVEATPFARWKLFSSLDFFFLSLVEVSHQQAFAGHRLHVSGHLYSAEESFHVPQLSLQAERTGRNGDKRRSDTSHLSSPVALSPDLHARQFRAAYYGRLQSFPSAGWGRIPFRSPAGLSVYTAVYVRLSPFSLVGILAGDLFPYRRLRFTRLCVRTWLALYLLYAFVFRSRFPLVSLPALRLPQLADADSQVWTDCLSGPR